ncbi:MAG: monovalent cation/H+ antiporter subunit D family protein [Rhizobiales bacterium]|nr:monovalent cation/H+ antiporter subunit D family protein [Hyphomicrobiales bacterium]
MGLAEQLPALVVVTPLIGSLLTAVLPRGHLAWAVSLLVTWACAVMAFLLLGKVAGGEVISYHLGGWPPPWGIEYRIDRLSAFLLFLVTGVSAVMVPFALRSVESEIASHKQAWFYTMYLLCLCGLVGIVVTGDAFNAFVFLEISSLSAYAMIALGRDRRALVAAYQYLVMGTIGATFYVIGVGFLYSLTGSLNMVDVSTRLGALGFAPPVLAALAFLFVGLGLKLALFPLHSWLPGAYAYAPSFATTFLAATATKVAIYLMVRYFYSVFTASRIFEALPINDILIALSLAGIFGASIVAFFQSDIKRLLAYSSVSQIGYMTLGVGLANLDGLTGGLVHLLNHAVTKAALFLAVGFVFLQWRTCRLEDLAGIGRRMPLTLLAFAIAGMSLVGVPGTAGFVSKWYLALGAIEKGWWWMVIAIMVSSLISLFYVGRVLELAFMRPQPEVMAYRKPSVASSPWTMTVPLAVLTLAVVALGLDATYGADLARAAAEMLIARGP